MLTQKGADFIDGLRGLGKEANEELKHVPESVVAFECRVGAGRLRRMEQSFGVGVQNLLAAHLNQQWRQTSKICKER